MGAVTGCVSSVLDSFATCVSFISIHPLVDTVDVASSTDAPYMSAFMQNGVYWKVVAFCSAMGGNILPLGSVSGLALLKMERMHVGWYFKNVGVAAIIGWLLGLAVMWLCC